MNAAGVAAVELVMGAASGELRRQVGPNAWVVLEELLLGATLDEPSVGYAVSRATIRALAIRTGLSKDTVSRSIHKLRAAKVVTAEAERQDDSGRFVSVRYVIDLTRTPMAVRLGTSPTAAQVPALLVPVAPAPVSKRLVPVAPRPTDALSPRRPAVVEQLQMLGD